MTTNNNNNSTKRQSIDLELDQHHYYSIEELMHQFPFNINNINSETKLIPFSSSSIYSSSINNITIIENDKRKQQQRYYNQQHENNWYKYWNW